ELGLDSPRAAHSPPWPRRRAVHARARLHARRTRTAERRADVVPGRAARHHRLTPADGRPDLMDRDVSPARRRSGQVVLLEGARASHLHRGSELMAWYPEGSGSGPTDKPAEPSDDMPTLSQQTAVQR